VQKEKLELSRKLIVANSKEIMEKLPENFKMGKGYMTTCITMEKGDNSFVPRDFESKRFMDEKLYNATWQGIATAELDIFIKGDKMDIYERQIGFYEAKKYIGSKKYIEDPCGNSEELMTHLYTEYLLNHMSPQAVVLENTNDNLLMSISNPVFVSWLSAHNIELSDLNLFEVEQKKSSNLNNRIVSAETVEDVFNKYEPASDLYEAVKSGLCYNDKDFIDVKVEEVGEPITAEELEVRNAAHVDKDEEEDVLAVEA